MLIQTFLYAHSLEVNLRIAKLLELFAQSLNLKVDMVKPCLMHMIVQPHPQEIPGHPHPPVHVGLCIPQGGGNENCVSESLSTEK